MVKTEKERRETSSILFGHLALDDVDWLSNRVSDVKRVRVFENQ